MRLATVLTPRGPRLHVRGADGYIDAADAVGDERLADVTRVLAGGAEMLDLVRRAGERSGREVSVTEGDLGPAVPAPRRILCLGVNYAEHAAEGGRPRTTWPEVFVRGSDTVAAPYGEIVKPALSASFDYEGELGVVIGRGGRYIRAEDALSAVAGYVVVMDGTAREWQRAASQWTAGKNFDGTMPIGPEIVTADEVDVADVQLTTRLNGEVMQSARTSQMIFDVPRTIEFLSSFTTLRPGDVIATGTPGGVGFARQPPVWLVPGDVIEVTVEGVGRIENRVVAEDRDGVAAWPWTPPVVTAARL
ncbi:MAG TPA: fumarylacetoacetate hydrolase family protein [Solirubrobacteraceae bacterium]|nr:fumarylacetoacetate hydrolase family protein [Solirubrobacteraceae bacterium]